MNDTKLQIKAIMSALNETLRSLNDKRSHYTSLVQKYKTELFELSVHLDELNRTRNSYLGHANTNKHIFSPITPTVENEVKELKLAKEIAKITEEQAALLEAMHEAEESLHSTEKSIRNVRTARVSLVELGKNLNDSQDEAKKFASLFLDYSKRLTAEQEKNAELSLQIEELKSEKADAPETDEASFEADDSYDTGNSDNIGNSNEEPDDDFDDDLDDDFVFISSPSDSSSTSASNTSENAASDQTENKESTADDDGDSDFDSDADDDGDSDFDSDADDDGDSDLDSDSNTDNAEDESTSLSAALAEHGEQILMFDAFEKTYLASILDRKIRAEILSQKQKLEVLHSIVESSHAQEIISDLENSNQYLDAAIRDQLRKLYYYFNDNRPIGILLDDYLTQFREKHPEFVVEGDFELIDYEQVLSYIKALSLIILLNIYTDNIVRHSNATRIQLKIQIDSSNIHVTLSDNGIGISDEKLEKAYWYSGIHKADEIIFLLGGNVSINGSSEGTTVEFQYSAE